VPAHRTGGLKSAGILQRLCLIWYEFCRDRWKDEALTMEMKTYYLCLLRKCPAWTPEETLELAWLQEQHVAHNLSHIASDAKLAAGPVDDGSDIRGISIFQTATQAEARAIAAADPAGRFVVELHPWMVPVGMLP